MGAAWLTVAVTATALVATVLAAAMVLALARSSGAGWLAAATWAVGLAIVAPLVIIRWKRAGEVGRASADGAWLSLVWNASAVLVASQLVPDLLGTALRQRGAEVVTQTLGDSHGATRMVSALAQYSADIVRPDHEVQVAAPVRSVPAADDALVIAATDVGGRTAFVVDTTFEGSTRTQTAPYLFDTGATLTTIPSELATELGIAIPADAPRMTFDTANGERESVLVRVPAITLGATRIRDVVVSICDNCGSSRYRGLLGHNVMRHFSVHLDFAQNVAVLTPHANDGDCDRASDIREFVGLDVEGEDEVYFDRVHWLVGIRNHAEVPLREVIPTVQFDDGTVLRGAAIDSIAPGLVGRSLVRGRVGGPGSDAAPLQYRLGLAHACW
jgi:clan AA aspartic protease (TIGR02281 family)